jgi:nicotinamide-nucleotide amidase
MADLTSPFPPDLIALAERVLNLARAEGLRIATVESCTGGLIAGLLTEIAGSSEVVERGYVTYSNKAKTDLVGVPPQFLEAYGAVSETVARAMAEGGLRRAPVQLAVSVTGIAGPSGATQTKPVGLVHFALARLGHDTRAEHHVLAGDRSAIRLAAVANALRLLEASLSGAT